MNKDLDARLLASDEYRDAYNIAVSKSEGDDVGALENVLGNIQLTDFGLNSEAQGACGKLEVIGVFSDVANDNLLLFLTDYTDSSQDKLSNFAFSTARCHIVRYNTVTLQSSILVSGSFLNFSKTHPVYGINIIEDFLFFTDDRNQPRKINWKRAIEDPNYYNHEDNISVPKFYPFEAINLHKNTAVTLSIQNGGSGFSQTDVSLNNPIQITIPQIYGLVPTTFYITQVSGSGAVTGVKLADGGYGYPDDLVNTNIYGYYPASSSATGPNGLELKMGIQQESTMKDVVSKQLPGGYYDNPFYDPDWNGDKDFLKDKFVRFAYRFKFEDSEYSLISPFTQECFVPKQDGYFIGNDDTITYQSTEVEFFENKINDIDLMIQSPNLTSLRNEDDNYVAANDNWAYAAERLKLKEIDIIYKQSNETNLKVLDTIKITDLLVTSSNAKEYLYNYRSEKPYRVLPSNELLRVYDQTPVRALAQETAGNRIIYGNFVNKHTPPDSLNYNVGTSYKGTLPENIQDYNSQRYSTIRKEYQNHTLKQNRNYQVGVVLCDKYGRQSTTLLSSIDSIVGVDGTKAQGSSLFHGYKPQGKYERIRGADDNNYDFGVNLAYNFDIWPNYVTNTGGLLNDKSGIKESGLFYSLGYTEGEIPPLPLQGGFSQNSINLPHDTWPGDALNITFNKAIESVKDSSSGTPGLWSETNPTGWYSWKIVVKQSEQEYYNVYAPGILNGYIDGESKNPLHASPLEPITHIILHGDNISKVPRDLTLLGPNQLTFRTGRPSVSDDPSYYEFVDTSGEKFTVDPYSEEGEKLLKDRDRKRDLDSGSIIKNSSVKMNLRVNSGQLLNLPVVPVDESDPSRVNETEGDFSLLVRPLKSLYFEPTIFGINNQGGDYDEVGIWQRKKVVEKLNQVLSSYYRTAGIGKGEYATGPSSQSYGTNEDTVVTIGTGTDLGLWNPTALPPYNTAPSLYSYKTNPLVAKIKTNEQSIASVPGSVDFENITFFPGMEGPSPNAHKLSYEFCTYCDLPQEYRDTLGNSNEVSTWSSYCGDEFGSATGKGYVPESKNVNCTITAGPTAKNWQELRDDSANHTSPKAQGLICNIEYVVGGAGKWAPPSATAGDLNNPPFTTAASMQAAIDDGTVPESAKGLPNGGRIAWTSNFGNSPSLSVANEDLIGLVNFKEGYYQGKVTGAGDSEGRFFLKVSRNNHPGFMQPSLSVHEIEPIESKLDIYWETTTSGTISSLNTDITEGDEVAPYGIRRADTLGPVVFSGSESDGVDYIGPRFLLVNQAGQNTSTLQSGTSLLNLTVTDNNGIVLPSNYFTATQYPQSQNVPVDSWEISIQSVTNSNYWWVGQGAPSTFNFTGTFSTPNNPGLPNLITDIDLGSFTLSNSTPNILFPTSGDMGWRWNNYDAPSQWLQGFEGVFVVNNGAIDVVNNKKELNLEILSCKIVTFNIPSDGSGGGSGVVNVDITPPWDLSTGNYVYNGPISNVGGGLANQNYMNAQYNGETFLLTRNSEPFNNVYNGVAYDYMEISMTVRATDGGGMFVDGVAGQSAPYENILIAWLEAPI